MSNLAPIKNLLKEKSTRIPGVFYKLECLTEFLSLKKKICKQTNNTTILRVLLALLLLCSRKSRKMFRPSPNITLCKNKIEP